MNRQALLLLAIAATASQSFAAEPILVSNAEKALETAIQVETDPPKKKILQDALKKLQQLPNRSIQSDELAAKLAPPPSVSQDKLKRFYEAENRRHPQKGAVPIDAFSRDAAANLMDIQAVVDPKNKPSMDILDAKYHSFDEAGHIEKDDWFTAAEIRDVLKNGVKYPDIPAAPLKLAPGWQPLRLLIRHDWTDVLTTEDLSQTGAKAKADDLIGATISYTHDEKASSDSWSAVGALILPFEYDLQAQGGLAPDHIMAVPSVSLNRITTNSPDSSGEVDQLFFRFGLYTRWDFDAPMSEIELRAVGVYASDTSLDSRMPGFELDLEPRFLWDNSSRRDNLFKIGYRNRLWRKAARKADLSDQSILDYQLRVWLHMEGGDIQDIGKAFAVVPGSFFRLGPTVQMRLNFIMAEEWKEHYHLPFQSFSFTGQYSYLPSVEGPKGHDSLLSLTAGFTLLEDDQAHEKVMLNFTYTKGGVIFTKQDVDVFTAGLGILF